jgi:hypothetical protein
MKEGRHRIRTFASAHVAETRQEAVGSTAPSAEPPPSLLRMLISFGDGLDEDTVDAWTEVLRPRRHSTG